MNETAALQLDDLQCFNCGNPPMTNVPLFEMQNHSYICNTCRITEERQGKHIAWANGLQLDDVQHTPIQVVQEASPDQPVKSSDASLPDSLFGILGVSLTASDEEVLAAIRQKIGVWMTAPSSDEKDYMIERLRDWKNEIDDDPDFLARERAKLQPRSTRSRVSALTLGSRQATTIEDFVAACEADAESWHNAEILLHDGNLEFWVYAQGNQVVATEVHAISQENGSNFQKLNHILYRLMAARPFRFYRQAHWQPLSEVPTATSPQELAVLCDRDWERGKTLLNNGSMLTWLELSRGSQGLLARYHEAARQYTDPSTAYDFGLEFVLEDAVPTLRHPEVAVSFDGSPNAYTLEEWDSELPHQVIIVRIDNTTRGFVRTELALANPLPTSGPDWIVLEDSHRTQIVPTLQKDGTIAPVATQIPVPVVTFFRPGESTVVKKKLFLQNLSQLGYGKKYQCLLRVSEVREQNRPRITHEYPITITTLNYRQGFRRHLWNWGLRGNLPGLFWNFLAGSLYGLLLFLLVPALVHSTVFDVYDVISPQIILSLVAGGLKTLLLFLGPAFALVTGVILGLAGFSVGLGKGHANYPTKLNAKMFRTRSIQLTSLFCMVFFVWLVIHYNILSNRSYGWYVGGILLLSLLIVFFSYILSFIRSYIEKLLRRRYNNLLQQVEGE